MYCRVEHYSRRRSTLKPVLGAGTSRYPLDVYSWRYLICEKCSINFEVICAEEGAGDEKKNARQTEKKKLYNRIVEIVGRSFRRCETRQN